MRAMLPAIHLSTPAWVTHLAWTEAEGTEAADRTRGVVRLGLDGREVAFALEDEARGQRDHLLCAAVAGCLDANVRRAAARARVTIERLAILVTADVDIRGSLGEAGVPVGFQSMRVEVQLRLAARDRAATAHTVATAERLCVTLQTLRASLPIELVLSEDH